MDVHPGGQRSPTAPLPFCGYSATARLLLNKGPKVSHGALAVLQLPQLNMTAIKEQTAAIILSLSWLL